MIGESSFKPAANPIQLPNLTIKISNLFIKSSSLCDSLGSVDKRAEQNCLVNHHNPHIILGQESRLGPFHLVKSSLRDLCLSAWIESWAVVASSS